MGGVTLEKIRIGIVGYGNLGKGAELGIRQNKRYGTCRYFYKKKSEFNQAID